MADGDRRRGAATATVGAGMVAGGGHLRERGIRGALKETGKRRPGFPRPLFTALGHGASGRSRLLYGGGSALGLMGAPAFAVGANDLVRGKQGGVNKADQPHRSFVEEGILGTRDAVAERAQQMRQPAPPKATGTALAVGAGSGALGSLATHRAFDRFARGSKLRPAATALAGTVAATSAFPLTRKAVARTSPGYEMTPHGVRRKKRAPVRPSQRANVVETRSNRAQTLNSRQQLVPSDGRFAKLSRLPTDLRERDHQHAEWAARRQAEQGRFRRSSNPRPPRMALPRPPADRSVRAVAGRHLKWGAGGTGVAALGIGALHARDHDVREDAAGGAGALAGQGAYQYAGIRGSARIKRSVKANKLKGNDRKVLRRHRKAHGIPGGDFRPGEVSSDQWTGFFRNYPKHLPDAKLRRVMGHTHGGRSGTALGAAATLAGGLAGAGALHQDHLHKADAWRPDQDLALRQQHAQNMETLRRWKREGKIGFDLPGESRPKRVKQGKRAWKPVAHGTEFRIVNGRIEIRDPKHHRVLKAARAPRGHLEELRIRARLRQRSGPGEWGDSTNQYRQMAVRRGLPGAYGGTHSLGERNPLYERGNTPLQRERAYRDRIYKAADPMDYPGAHMTSGQKRAAVYAAGGPPIIGDFTSAAMAGHLAPPEQRRRAAATQYLGSNAGSWGGAAAGAYGGAALARKVPAVNRGAQALQGGARSVRQGAADRLPKAIGRHVAPAPAGTPPKMLRAASVLERRGAQRGARALRAAWKPLSHAPAAAVVGGMAGQIAGGTGSGWAAMSANLRAEQKRNAKLSNGVRKVAGLTHREKVEQYRRKRRNVALSTMTTTAGAVGAGALALSHGGHLPRIGPKLAANKEKIERIGLHTALVGGGLGAVQGAQSIGIQHRDLRGQAKELRLDEVGKAFRTPSFRRSSIAMRRGRTGVLMPVHRSNGIAKMARPRMVPKGGFKGTRKLESKPAKPVEVKQPKPTPAAQPAASKPWAAMSPAERRRRMLGNTSGGIAGAGLSLPRRRPGRWDISKLETTMDHKNAHQLVRQYGPAGRLPKDLPRPERMRAYEARYVVAGGPKGERWQHRADHLDRVTGASLGVGGAAAVTELATHHRRPRIATKANRVALGAAGIGALSELAHRHAEHKARSYSGSRAGVAASALRRMRDYDPEDN